MKAKTGRRLRTVLISRNAYRWQYGGAEQFSYNLAACLMAEGVKPVVVSRVPELIRYCRESDISTFKNLWLRNAWRPMFVYHLLTPLLVAQYICLLLWHRADLLVAQSRDDQIFATMAAKLVGVPVVWIDHADMKHLVAQRWRTLERSYYWAMQVAGRVVITSNAERERITAAGLQRVMQSNFVTINNGALRRSGNAMQRRADIKIVIYAGRLSRDKGLFDLVEAAAAIVEKVPEAEFWIAGKGPDEAELRRRISGLGLEAHFKLLGHMDNVWDLLLTGDLFVYPTHHDAAPLAPVEAMLAGLPVVATQIGGIPEMVPESAGVLVAAHEPSRLAAEIITMFTDGARLARLREGAKVAASTHAFDMIVRNKYLPLFREAVEG